MFVFVATVGSMMGPMNQSFLALLGVLTCCLGGFWKRPFRSQALLPRSLPAPLPTLQRPPPPHIVPFAAV